MSHMTAIGPGAHVEKDGDFAVACGDGEQLLIHADGSAEWVGEMSLKQAAAGAAATIVKALWGQENVSQDFRAVVLTRLYDRLPHHAREASLKGHVGAKRTLAHFNLKQTSFGDPEKKDIDRAIALLHSFDNMNDLSRQEALETLIVAGLDLSREARS